MGGAPWFSGTLCLRSHRNTRNRLFPCYKYLYQRIQSMYGEFLNNQHK